ncbi:MAG: dTDP-4-dehydrorhamnose reductase [Planctomycetes bacterium]|nr:dTDP-4-dehydrorhamnose reductase [Planctomycetota bacterium]
MNDRVLLIGSDGMLGRAWASMLRLARVDFDAPTLEEFDLTNADSIDAGVTAGHGRVINCAGYTDVDGAEGDESKALAVNATGVGRLADACRRVGATLVHYSTDYVFDGSARTPYATDHARSPLGAYGRTKAAGEEAIERSRCDHLIVRTSWMYAPWGNNFVRTIARLARERDTLRVVIDQRGRPCSAEHLARTTLALLNAGQRGIRHASDGGECTWYEFAVEIARLTAPDCHIEPCSAAEFPRPAPRPAYSVLDLGQTESVVGPMIHWRSNLSSVVDRLEQE